MDPIAPAESNSHRFPGFKVVQNPHRVRARSFLFTPQVRARSFFSALPGKARSFLFTPQVRARSFFSALPGKARSFLFTPQERPGIAKSEPTGAECRPGDSSEVSRPSVPYVRFLRLQPALHLGGPNHHLGVPALGVALVEWEGQVRWLVPGGEYKPLWLYGARAGGSSQ